MKIINKTRETIIAENAIVGDHFFSKLRGLLFRRLLWSEFEAIYLKSVNSIHTIGLSSAIDLIAIDQNGLIKDCRTIKPWRLYIGQRSIKGIIECPTETIKKARCEPGDQLIQLNGKGW